MSCGMFKFSWQSAGHLNTPFPWTQVSEWHASQELLSSENETGPNEPSAGCSQDDSWHIEKCKPGPSQAEPGQATKKIFCDIIFDSWQPCSYLQAITLGSVFWLHLPVIRRKSRRDELTKVFEHFHSISFHQLFPHRSLCTHTFYPKDISQPCKHMSNFKFNHLSGSIISPPARRGARDSPKVCYLETNNIFPLARTKKRTLKTLLCAGLGCLKRKTVRNTLQKRPGTRLGTWQIKYVTVN